MIDAGIRSALITILKSKRRKMNPAQRKRSLKPSRWLYPWTTEKRYTAAIRAWFRPMRDYVRNYLKEHSEAILHGDSANLVVRQDATTGRSFTVMVRSLDAWVGQYISDDPQRKRESPIYMGLGNIADTVYDFNEGQYEKSAKAALGIEFPVGEDWWPDARDTWRDRNYDLIRSDLKRYVSQVNDLTERAVTSGWSLSEMTRQMMAVDSKMSEGRARFVARDQIGKLNGHITQRRMESAGLSMYIWSTSGDERVRGDPGGFFPNADSSHYAMDGLLCRWDDPTVYSDDGGKTWRDRPSGAVKLHPGDDYQCRCTALAYWNEIVDEVDEQIDLLSENVDNIPDTRNQELLIMNPPSARSENETLKAQAEAREVKRRQSNAKKAKQFADQEYPGEKWEILEDGIIQSSRRKTDATTAADELRDAQILRDFGSTVYLVPEINTRTKGARNYDAIVNGMKMEFKTLSTKNPKTLRDHFWDSRGQAPNVFINLENSPLTRRQVVSTLYEARNNPEYATHSEKNKGGRVILKIKGRENLIYINVDDLKVPEQ